MGKPIKDLTGKIFNSLTVLRMADHRIGKENRVGWVCQCVCGSEVIVVGPNLENGGTKSCGCHRKQRCADTLIDLTGQQFGNWTVVERDTNYKAKESYWITECACGNRGVVSGTNLRSGESLSCGCLRNNLLANKMSPDLTGNKYGTLTVLYRSGFRDSKCFWVAECECGSVREYSTASLKSIQSCGCKTNEILSKAMTKHGMHGTPEYRRSQSHKHREVSRLQDSEWTLEMEMCIEELFPTCVVCDRTKEESYELWGKSLTLDHVVPLSKGGGLKPGNVVVLCQVCNSKKSNKDLSSLPQDVQDKILSAAALFAEVWSTYEPPVYDEPVIDDSEWEGWL